jgi:hypothetical protein
MEAMPMTIESIFRRFMSVCIPLAGLVLLSVSCSSGSGPGGKTVSAVSEKKLEFQVHKASLPIVVDGRRDEKTWDGSMVATDFAQPWHPTAVKESGLSSTKVRMLWDDTNLYVLLAASETNVQASVKTDQGPLWDDGRVMVYIDFDPDNKMYYGLEINAAGAVLSFHADLLKPTDGEKFNPTTWDISKMPGVKFEATVDGTLNNSSDTDKGYTVELAIPWSAMPQAGTFKPQAGGTFNVGLFRIQPVEGRPAFEWIHSLWSQVHDVKPNFHYPASFVPVVLK